MTRNRSRRASISLRYCDHRLVGSPGGSWFQALIGIAPLGLVRFGLVWFGLVWLLSLVSSLPPKWDFSSIRFNHRARVALSTPLYENREGLNFETKKDDYCIIGGMPFFRLWSSLPAPLPPSSPPCFGCWAPWRRSGQIF